MKYTINRYLVVSIEVDADSPQEALIHEQYSDTDVSITDGLYPLTWEWSSNPAWVIDEHGDTILEEDEL